MLDAVFYVVDNGVKWRALPVDFSVWVPCPAVLCHRTLVFAIDG
jgi:hypothetical protein